jgi:aminobenzoyl-glutamate utilization protein B
MIYRNRPLSGLWTSVFLALCLATCVFGQQTAMTDRQTAMKANVAAHIEEMQKQAQVMVDSVFSFGELGFQEFETSKYLTGILDREGFRLDRGIAGIPGLGLPPGVRRLNNSQISKN